ncbi:MAG: hypothetical protein RLZZ612_2463 [Pseudomonadota bacterium]
MPAYNRGMKSVLNRLTRVPKGTQAVWLGLVVGACPAWAQEATPIASKEINPRVERLHHEDSGSKVDELRVGGLTRRIEVQTKVGADSSYQIEPSNTPAGAASPASERSGASGNAGRSSWRLFQF